jgi:hypothetical protein
MKTCHLLAGAIAATMAFSGVNALASDAAAIFSDASGTAVTYDNASGAFPVITFIGSQPNATAVDGYTYTSYAFLAADSTGSLDIFGKLPTGSTYVPTVGDGISLSGTYSPFDGIAEIETLTAITQQSTGNTVPGPLLVTIPQLAVSTLPQNITGTFLELANVTLFANSAGTTPVSGPFPTHADASYFAKDGSGNIQTVFFDPSSYSVSAPLGGTAIPTGTVDIFGIADIFDGASEFVPFEFVPVPEPTTLTLCGAGALLAFAFRSRRKA